MRLARSRPPVLQWRSGRGISCVTSGSGSDVDLAKARNARAARALGGRRLQITWAFKGAGLAGHDTLIDAYPDQEFDSPTRSTIPLLEYWRSPEQRVRELTTALGLLVPPRVQLNFEHKVRPPRGRGNSSHTDLMVSSPGLAIAIEAKWTEPRYKTVGDWLDGSTNREEVLQGWCDLLEQRSANPILEGDLHGLPYQMVHRAASACQQRNASSCWLVYLVFETTEKQRSEYLADLAHLRAVLGSRSSLGIALAECSMEQTRFLIELRRRWSAGERHLHAPVLQKLKNGFT